ncbi:MAG: hypothetical protein LUF92_14665 [Clostridiales bacterium]|nr:hypothetical protein [Clostridiales bacterium]
MERKDLDREIDMDRGNVSDTEETRKTVGMPQRSKEELFEKGHPVVRTLREIPNLVFAGQEEELPAAVISLKKLFTRKQMDKNHVDCLVLYKIAEKVLHILMELSQRGICAGLIDIADFYVNVNTGELQVYLTHPERFQLLHFEQDYEWYPEDERLFGDVRLFDRALQQKADLRLLYKILVASTKGNVKIPPKHTEADYSELFYRTLPDEWKQIFQEGAACDYEVMREMFRQYIEMEESFDKETKKRLDDKAERKARRQAASVEMDADANEKTVFCLIALLRTELEESAVMSRLLYLLQDELEIEAKMAHFHCQQAFVFGNGAIAVKEFAKYPSGFRCQCEQKIREYSAAEALLIAVDRMDDVMRDHKDCEFRLYVLADGRLENDKMFQTVISMIEKKQKEGLKFYFLAGEDSRCEACQKLENLMTSSEETLYKHTSKKVTSMLPDAGVGLE